MGNQTKPGIERFEKYLQRLEQLLLAANAQREPVVYLFENDMRTPLFMLEGLARIYRKLHNEKSFEKLLEKFKELEDALGAVDYFSAWERWGRENNLPAVTKYFAKHKQEANQEFEKILHKRDWLDTKDYQIKRIEKIRKRLQKADWLTSQEEPAAIKKFFNETCLSLSEKCGALDLTLLEDGIHEFRRSVRWLSIYAQCLNGLIQLQDDNLQSTLLHYLTQEVVESPFNKMPESEAGHSVLSVRRSLFYALSYIIAETGRLKDEGQKLEAITEYLHDQKESSYEVKARELTGVRPLPQIVQTAAEKIQEFLNHKILEQLAEDFK